MIPPTATAPSFDSQFNALQSRMEAFVVSQNAAMQSKTEEILKAKEGEWKAKEVELKAEFKLQLAEKEAAIRIITAKAGKSGEDRGGDGGDEDGEYDDIDDGQVSQMTKGSGGPKQVKKDPEVKDFREDWKNNLEAQLEETRFLSPEAVACDLESKDGFLAQLVNGSIVKVKVLNYASHAKKPSLEITCVAPPLAEEKKSSKSTASSKMVVFATDKDMRQFAAEQTRLLTSMSLSVDDLKVGVNAIQDWTNFWCLTPPQTTGIASNPLFLLVVDISPSGTSHTDSSLLVNKQNHHR